MGWSYYNGECVKKDLKQAAKYFFKAVKKGSAEAYYAIGVCIAELNEPSPENDSLVMTSMLKACDGGFEKAPLGVHRVYGKYCDYEHYDFSTQHAWSLVAEHYGDALAKPMLKIEVEMLSQEEKASSGKIFDSIISDLKAGHSLYPTYSKEFENLIEGGERRLLPLPSDFSSKIFRETVFIFITYITIYFVSKVSWWAGCIIFYMFSIGTIALSIGGVFSYLREEWTFTLNFMEVLKSAGQPPKGIWRLYPVMLIKKYLNGWSGGMASIAEELYLLVKVILLAYLTYAFWLYFNN